MTIKKLTAAPITHPIENIVIGYGLGNSATIGAQIAAILPSNLAKPNAVCEYKGLNSSANDKYTTLNRKLIPTLASIIISGMNLI